MSEGTALRRGLPRRAGGAPWPEVEGNPAPGSALAQTPSAAEKTEAPGLPAMQADGSGLEQEREVRAASAATETAAAAAPSGTGTIQLRRGLPRTPGGEAWPAGGAAAVPAPARAETGAAAATSAAATSVDVAPAGNTAGENAPGTGMPAGAAPEPAAPGGPGGSTRTYRLRQGLPRTTGGTAWPSVSEVQVHTVDAWTPAAAPAADEPAVPVSAVPETQPVSAESSKSANVPVPGNGAARPEPAADTQPKPSTQPNPAAQPNPASPAQAPSGSPGVQDPPRVPNRWVKPGLAAAALVLAAAAAVLCSRWFLSSGSGTSFLAAYPGEYHLPEGAPVGLPAWLGWQHFMNVFLMVLIIRSGLQIRREKRPTAYWTPKGRNGGKVSLTVWLHQSLDLLWLVNGAVFIVLLFATGQWMRVIPTSWEVFPNAVSAGLQYMSLDWPTDNGWVNYNALQQLAYFVTIFIAAPLAAATGFRMSGMWPKKAQRAGKAFPIEAARRVHFPVMLYFVAFIAVHVILVFATGALRNLNHMYAAQGSTDPGAYASNWTGFWLFVLSLAVIVGAAVLANRPFVLAPVASAFGKVSSR